MHAIFFMNDSSRYLNAGLEDCHVYLFDSEQAAYDFAFEKMVEVGLIEGDAARVLSHEAKRDNVDEVQNSFGMLEYFHVYPVVDCRESMTRAAENV